MKTHYFPFRSFAFLLLVFCLLEISFVSAFAQTAADATTSSATSSGGPTAPTAPSMPSTPSVSGPTLPAAPLVSLQLGGGDGPQNISMAIQIVFVMTLLTLAPSLVMLMTSFTRIVIVLSFIRTALGVPTAPSNQILIGMAMIMTFYIMAPVGDRIYNEALIPYNEKQIDSATALERAGAPLKNFMLTHTRPSELEFFLKLSASGPTAVADLPFSTVLPAFMISELRIAFQMGFLIFVPFMVIDFLVGSVLMSMGMMMMPPTMVSMPLKLLLFVLVDGWQLVIRSLLQSFGI